ncbi:T9SS type A sorting domain-containing protein [Flavobacterium lindanitolerans]|uniref:type IX secretion system anionic LPS delivery protein PorZ n=1 Tax=Flavobacterium lindanitolerans TaxID=428988 RepID=UPI00280A3D60|nr:T9SS type A sorting domain-containing protein [Flavobacterium lindanitolerans]MDQ7959449.1 T9SS type A sorting domain-containing protein [Flavobacterium lindanitolerans]
MKKQFLIFLFSFFIQIAFAQNNQLWKGYFSYNEVNDLTESATRITGATQKSLFSKNLATNELKTVTTINGLSGQDITAVYYSQAFNKTIIGHANGLMLILTESTGHILIVPGIRDQAGLTPNRKRINHFYEHEGKLYISCDFGVVQYNLATLGFGDTYLLGPAGEEVKAYQSTVLNNFIYVATAESGIRRADLSNPNLNDFNQWQTFDSGIWTGIVAHNNQIVGISANRVARHTGTAFATVTNLMQPGIDLRSYQNNLIATTLNHVYTYNENFSQTAHIVSSSIPEMTAAFNCATVIDGTIYIGTKENGIISTEVTNTATFLVIKPDGPAKNNIFAIQTTPTGKLWAVYGGYNVFYVPDVSSNGISKFSENGWLNIPYEDVLQAHSLSRITINPSNENQLYISSFHSGLLKVENDIVVAKYDHTTQNGPESLFFGPDPNYKSVRINGAGFDRSGNLWFNNSRVENAIKVLKTNGSWQSYSIDGFATGYLEQDYGRMAIDKNGTKWFVSSLNGVIGFNENAATKFRLAASQEDAGNPLIKNAIAVAVDNRNQLWIGTMQGLRVLPSVDRFMGESDLETNPIIIIEDGLPQELLYEQFITDIVVDGANNKWIGTADSGVFLVSSNGQQTIHRFTRENSPLPSNSINDIDINAVTGEVFFATTAGLVSFQGTSTKGNDDLSQVYIYPNPVRPEFTGTVKISGLINDANIKITDIEGNLVYETTSEGGTIEWDTKAFGKYRVASGVYMVFISSKDGSETKVKKVMIIR